MAARRLGRAFTEVVADTDHFERDLVDALDRAVKEASKSKHFDPMVAAAALAGEKAGDEFGDRLARQMQRRSDRNRGRIFAFFTTPFMRIGEAAGDLFSQGFAASLRGLPIAGNLARGVTGGLASILESGPLALGGLLLTIGPLVVLIPLLASAIFALGGVLTSLVGIVNVLPGPLFGLLATLAPLIIAFQGFGEAVSAIASGDLEKIDEALKNLSPSAQSVLREIQGLMPFFGQLRKDTQQAFFVPLVGSLDRLFKALGPALSGGLQNTALALGGFVDQLLVLFGKPETVDFIARLFEAVAEGIDKGGPSIIRFIDAMFAVADASLPVISQLFENMGAGLDRFSAFLQDSAASGEFNDSLQSALDTIGSILSLTGQLLGLFKDMFATTDESGRTFLDDVGLAIGQLREFFQSPEGKKFIEDMIVLAEDFGDALIFVANLLALHLSLFAALTDAADKLGNALEDLFNTKGLTSFLGIFANLSSPLGGALFGKAATGGITQGPVIAGEAGREAILPLDDPIRARQIAEDPLVAQILDGGNTTVFAYFDGEPFQARIVRTVKGEQGKTARQFTQKPRTT